MFFVYICYKSKISKYNLVVNNIYKYIDKNTIFDKIKSEGESCQKWTLKKR